MTTASERPLDARRYRVLARSCDTRRVTTWSPNQSMVLPAYRRTELLTPSSAR